MSESEKINPIRSPSRRVFLRTSTAAAAMGLLVGVKGHPLSRG